MSRRTAHILLTPRINCATLYATPVGPHGITEEYDVNFTHTSKIRISGINMYI